MNYDKLNKFTGSLIYSIQRLIIFSAMARRGGMAQCLPLNTLTGPWLTNV